MSGKWNKPDIPHKGWTITGIIDMGTIHIDCDMCESQKVRFAHIATHPNFTGDLYVGCVCADNMSVGYNGKKAEAKLKSTARKRIQKKSFGEVYGTLKYRKFNLDAESQLYVLQSGWLIEDFCKELERHLA